MKITFIWRGPSPYRVDFFNELGKLCDLEVFFEMRPRDISDKNITWFHEDYTNFKACYLNGKRFFHRLWFCPSIIFKLPYLRKSDITVLGMYSTPTQMLLIFLFKLLRIPYILNSDGGFIKQDSKLGNWIKHKFIGGASGYLSSSERTSEYLQFYGAKAPCYIYPFTSAKKSDIDIAGKQANKLFIKKELNITEDIVILFSGQFIPRKGIDTLLKASTNLPENVGVYIVGGKPCLEYLSLVDELQLKNIHFIDFKTPIELSNYYQAADIYVLPTREDIWGLVINEAMAYGLPVITTTNCLSGTELIENGKNGFLIEPDDFTTLNSHLIKLATDHNLRKKMRINNLSKIQNYTIENMAQRHFSIFNQIIK